MSTINTWWQRLVLSLIQLHQNAEFSLAIAWRSISVVLLISIVWVYTANAANLTVTVNSSGDESDSSHGDDLCQTALGSCTLRAAIEELNAQGVDNQPHEIHFDILGPGPHTIFPQVELPDIQVPILIDGATQPGVTCPTAAEPAGLKIVLDGSLLPGSSNGLYLGGAALSSSGSTIRGLVIGNFDTGINVHSNENRIECNHLGLAADGVSRFANRAAGLTIYNRSGNIVGGTDNYAQRNVISGNLQFGLQISQPFLGEGDNEVSNNFIGTTADGQASLSNRTGVVVSDMAATGNLIGGTQALSRNVISGNQRYGIRLTLTEGNELLGNYIGVAADGVTPLANGWDGVLLNLRSSNNIIGGLTPLAGNVIAFNRDNGILLTDDPLMSGNSWRGNAIIANGDLAIDLGADGPDNNDPLDGDTGPNGRQNSLELVTAALTGQIVGNFNSQANQQFEVDLYLGDGCDPVTDQVFLGATTVTTNGSGDAAVDVNFGPLAIEQGVAAVVTDSAGNSSEFSNCVWVDGYDPTAPLSYISDCFTDNPPIVRDQAIFLPTISSTDQPLNASSPAASGGLTLVDGGVVTGLEGVTLGAVSGTLTTTLTISVSHGIVPTATILTDPQVHGNYYAISASENLHYCDEAKGFILGLPVPNGVPTDTLAIAMMGVDSGSWGLKHGQYDASRQLLLVPLSGLNVKGSISVLVELSSSPAASSPYQSASGGPTFYIDCINGQFVTCPLDLSYINQFLDLQFTEMSDMGYPEPRISCYQQFISLDPPFRECQPNSYLLYVYMQDCQVSDGAPSGVYFRWLDDLSTPDMMFCLTATNQLFNVDKRAIRFHYFQAVSFGWPEHATLWAEWQAGDFVYEDKDWVIDSTAAAAMLSVPGRMESSNDYERRPVDVPLQSIEEEYEYQAQDFWVFVGRAQGDGMLLLEPLFEQFGATIDDVIDWFGTPEIFQEFYWGWVKNQVFLEDNILLNDDDPGEACQYTDHAELTYWHFQDPIYIVAEEPGSLDPLTTHVVEVEMGTTLRPAVIQVIDPQTLQTNPELSYKIYVDGEGGCADIADGERSFDEAAWDEVITTGSQLFVVIANINHEDEQKYEIVIETAPYAP